MVHEDCLELNPCLPVVCAKSTRRSLLCSWCSPLRRTYGRRCLVLDRGWYLIMPINNISQLTLRKTSIVRSDVKGTVCRLMSYAITEKNRMDRVAQRIKSPPMICPCQLIMSNINRIENSAAPEILLISPISIIVEGSATC